MNQVKQHLEESGMSYWTHLKHSIKQSNRLIAIALKSYVHGVLPWLWASAGPLGVYRIYKEIRHMHHVQRLFQNDK